MSGQLLAARLHFMARQLHGEAQRTTDPDVRADLERAVRQLRYSWSAAYSKDPELVAQARDFLDGAIDYLVDVMAARTERELEQGARP